MVNIPPILERHAGAIFASLEPCLDLKPVRTQGGLQPLSSCLFGWPCLHHVGDWPRSPEGRPLAFIGQIYLPQLPRDALQRLPLLPQEGLLSLFFDLDEAPTGASPEDRYRFRVIWTPDDAGGRLIQPPAGAITLSEQRWELEAALSERLPLEVDAAYRLGALSEDEFLAYDALAGGLAPPCEHRLLGPADWLDGDARGLCAEATSRLWPGGAWRLLWQVGGEPCLSEALGEDARLYVLIREEDLAERRFLRSWVVLQRM